VAEIFLGLGSNCEPERHLDLALDELAARFGPIDASRVYRNPAVGFAGDDFLNLAVRATTTLAPRRVVALLREIELAAARDRNGPRWGPRTLDVDLLIYGTLVDPLLRLPREDVLRHAFALCPLAEIAPGLVHPVSGQTIAAAWQAHIGAASPWTRHGWCLTRSLTPAGAAVVKGESLVGLER